MIKQFTLSQIFPLLDNRVESLISNNAPSSADDIAELINHVLGGIDLMPYHITLAFKYIQDKNPEWLIEGKRFYNSLDFPTELRTAVDLRLRVSTINQNNRIFDIPILEDTSDFKKFMLSNIIYQKEN